MSKYIDADALMEYLQEIKQQAETDNRTKIDALESTIDVINSTIMMKTDETMRIVENMPAADVEPVMHGEWINTHDRLVKCSLCGKSVQTNWRGFFCQNCGAKMDGGNK